MQKEKHLTHIIVKVMIGIKDAFILLLLLVGEVYVTISFLILKGQICESAILLSVSVSVCLIPIVTEQEFSDQQAYV